MSRSRLDRSRSHGCPLKKALTPARLRECVEVAKSCYRISERRPCRLVGLARSSHRYQSTQDDPAARFGGDCRGHEQFITAEADAVFETVLRFERSRDARRGHGFAFSDVLSQIVALIPPGMRTVSMASWYQHGVSVVVGDELFAPSTAGHHERRRRFC